ncbi:hypothetical protein [Sphingomonas glacialis]|uniref:hypothetical protein n=1 Tax=Sphingomonas glacialis TaxID=658225 RepID=UPI0011286D6F|nr:hypothetical protein [Sphingomonas glacialis]
MVPDYFEPTDQKDVIAASSAWPNLGARSGWAAGEEMLGDAGYHVLFASNGAAGVKVLQSRAHIDLLITDVGFRDGIWNVIFTTC